MAEQIMDISTGEAVGNIIKTNILVVDDRPDGLLALEAVLSNEEYTLFKASSGQEALRAALFNDFAVILMDVQMPEMDGFETAKLLRENYRTRTTPIIFVTAISKELRHINQGYENGAVDYIFKPFDPFILRSKISVFVELFQKNQQLKQQANLLRQIEAQEKERQILEIKQENYRSYSHLADAVPHSLIKIGSSGKIEYFNQRWLEYTGLKTDVDWAKIVHPQDKKGFLAIWLRMSTQHADSSETEIRLRRQDGEYRWHLVRAVPDIKNSEPDCWIVSCTDIDNIKRAEESFKNLSHELNRSNKELEEYAYVASHDLKEPLHVVSSFVYLLEKRFQSKLDPQEQQYLNFIKEGVIQAQRLIKDLLEYSRIGKEKIVETVNLASVVGEVLVNLKPFIDEAPNAVIQCGQMPQITANYLEMLQLFQNLIVNAIKYRNSKTPLEIKIKSKAEGKMWLISVQDNGIGIDPKFKDRIFDMFQRLHGKTEYSGTGIGLAICKKIAENHGGRIWIESALGQGTTFYFTLRQSL